MAKEEKFELPNEVIEVKPNFNNPGWIKNPRHAAFFKIEGTYDNYTCAMDRSGKVKNPFTKAEKAYLEDVLDLESNDLSVYKRGSMIRTTHIKLGKDGTKFDLSDPMDFFRYKILLTNTDKICPSIKDVKKKQTYKYYVERKNDVADLNKESADVNLTVYGFYGENKTNKTKLASAIRSFSQFTAKPIKKIDKKTSLEFLQGELLNIIKTDSKKFALMLNDPNYDTIALIGSAVDVGAIMKKGHEYFLEGGTDKIGSSLRETISYLDHPSHQELRLIIEEKTK